MHRILFRLGLPTDLAGGAYSVPPYPLAGFNGPTSKRRGGKGRGREEGRKGKEGRGNNGREREGGNVAFHHLLLSNSTTDQYITKIQSANNNENMFH